MTAEQANWLGLIAGTLTTISFVPQVWHTWKSRSAKDLSLGMLSIFTLGIALWLAYGLWMQAPPTDFVQYDYPGARRYIIGV